MFKKMAKYWLRHSTQTIPSVMLVLWLVGFARADFQSDQNECANQLVSLATCIQYVQGQAKAPTPDCCTGLKQVVAKSKKCLCILVKDRNEPGLGFKINATLALRLPGLCSSPLNATECIDLLHLPPNSADAQIFKQFEKGLEGSPNSTADAKGSSNVPSSGGSSSSVEIKSDGGNRGRQRWLVRDVILCICLWSLISMVAMAA